MLSRSLEPQATLQAIASIMVPAISDWCRVDLLDVDGNLQRALAHHSDPEKSRHGMELVNRLRAAVETPGSMAWTVATGQSHLARFDPPLAYDQIRDRDLLSFAETIGMRAHFIVPLTARGRTLGALAALQAESNRHFSPDDCALITELAQRVALALDNARVYGEAEAALREAGRANRAKDEFLAMLGHELRNPLAPIVTALHLMALRADAAGANERHIIERQVAHLSRLVDDLLDVSRITQGKIQLHREIVDLKSVVFRARTDATIARATRATGRGRSAAAAGMGRRRPGAAGAGAVQPALQRREIHRRRRRDPPADHYARSLDRNYRRRFRRRHQQRIAAACIRPVRAGPAVNRSQHRRSRPRARDRPDAGADARGHRQRVQRRRWRSSTSACRG